MLFPVPVGLPGGGGHDHTSEVLSGASVLTDAAAIMVHSTAMLVAMGLVAVVVYEKLGLGVLRKAWLNLDRVWATAVVAAGAVSLFT